MAVLLPPSLSELKQRYAGRRVRVPAGTRVAYQPPLRTVLLERTLEGRVAACESWKSSSGRETAVLMLRAGGEFLRVEAALVELVEPIPALSHSRLRPSGLAERAG